MNSKQKLKLLQSSGELEKLHIDDIKLKTKFGFTTNTKSPIKIEKQDSYTGSPPKYDLNNSPEVLRNQNKYNSAPSKEEIIPNKSNLNDSPPHEILKPRRKSSSFVEISNHKSQFIHDDLAITLEIESKLVDGEPVKKKKEKKNFLFVLYFSNRNKLPFMKNLYLKKHQNSSNITIQKLHIKIFFFLLQYKIYSTTKKKICCIFK